MPFYKHTNFTNNLFKEKRCKSSNLEEFFEWEKLNEQRFNSEETMYKI